MSHAIDDDEILDLSDHDIKTLFEIILRAQSLPGAPFGPSLFAAYDAFVTERDISHEDAQRYFRFLVRMVTGRTETDTPADRFKTLLESQGIQVDFDSDVQEQADVRTGEGSDYGEQLRDQDWLSLGQHSRPGSAGSRYGRGSWKTTERLDEDSDEPFGRRRHTRSTSRASDPTSARKRSRSGKQRPLERLPLRGRVSDWAASDSAHYQPRTRSVSLSSQGSVRVLRRDVATRRIRRHQTSSGISNRQAMPESLLSELDNHPSQTQLLADADTFEYHSKIRLARQMFWRWRDQTRAIVDRLHEQNAEAVSFYRRNLGREILTHLQAQLYGQREAREVARFWARKEAEAQAKWEVHLMAKALQHWANSAQEHVERTAVARRHILRNKYFNAWKEITAVNELKVQRFRLSKFFRLWRHRTHTVLDNGEAAATVFEDNITRRALRALLWTCRERITVDWAKDRVRRSFFYRWFDIVRKLKQRELLVEEMWRHDEQRRILQVWRRKLTSVREDHASADKVRRQKLLSNALRDLSLQARLTVPFDRVANAVHSRTTRSAIHLWHLRAQQSRQAAQVDRQRLLRNALMQWDDQLRCSWLQHRIDDRVVVEALYKLSIASKASMHARVHDYKLLSGCLKQWHSTVHAHSEALDDALSQWWPLQRQMKLRHGFHRLCSRYSFHLQEDTLAASHERLTTLPKALQLWRDRAQKLREMNRQADSARFYLLTTTAIKLWRGATHESQRLRRREAYIVIRRRCKTNLVRRAFGQWRGRAQLAHRMDQMAAERAEDRLLANATGAFRTWRDRSATYHRHLETAEALRRRRLASSALSTLQIRVGALAELDAAAAAFAAETAAAAAQKALSKLGWRLFQAQRQAQNALALREKHALSRARSMLRYWAERAAGRAAEPDAEEPSSEAEEEEEGFGSFMTTSTPLPGYLRTPSRRRSTAAVRGRLVALAARQGGTASGVPFTAPPAPPGPRSAAAATGAITPFADRLLAHGFGASAPRVYESRVQSRRGAALLSLPGSAVRGGASAAAAAAAAARGGGGTAFQGFADIREEGGGDGGQ